MRSKLLIGAMGAAIAFLLATNPLVAQAAGSITSSDIVNNTIKSKDVKNNGLKSTDIKNRTLKSADLTAGHIGVARGYAWNNQPSPVLGATVTLTNSYQFNSAGGIVTVQRTSVGNYTVEFTGLDWDPGNVQVTAYGTGTAAAARWCNVDGWGAPSVDIDCFDPAGAAADSRFTVAVFE
jgi:hypothetical protein